jgi:MoaA/NifB/PqqE/SkfB family radical SAM enzyme
MQPDAYERPLGDLVAGAPGLAAEGVRRVLLLRTVPAPQAFALAEALGRAFPRASRRLLTANPLPSAAPPGWDVVAYPFGRSLDRARTPDTWYRDLAGRNGFDLVVVPYADDEGLGYDNVKDFALPLLGRACLEVFGRGRLQLTAAGAFRDAVRAAGASATRPEAVGTRPHYVTLNLIERCNLRCVMCDIPDGLAYDTMPFERFERVAHALLPGCRTLTLNGFVGEPLLHPEFPRILRYIDERWPDIAALLATNATPLVGARLEAILGCGIVRELRISVNAFTRATYDVIMVRARYDQVMRNIREFMRLRRERGVAERLTATFSFVAMRQNVDELPDFVDWAADLGASQVLVWDCMDSQDGNVALSVAADRSGAEARYAEARTRAERAGIAITLPAPFAVEDPEGHGGEELVAFRCNLPWTHSYVSPNGDAVPCCYFNKVMGNVFEEPFEAIWNGPRYRQLRADITAGRYPTPCIGCPQNFDGTKRRPQEVAQKSRRIAD